MPEAQRSFVPDPPRDIFTQGTKALDSMNDFYEKIRPYDTATALAFLKTRFYGQPMTSRYRSQCAAVLCQELDRQNVRDVQRRAQLIEEAVEEHILERLNHEPRWSSSQIENVNRFNDGVLGRGEKRSPYWYWCKDNISISSDLNSRTPWQERDSFRLSHLMYPIAIAGGAILGLAALGYCAQKSIKLLTSMLSSTPTTSITIQNPNLQQVLPLLTGTAHNSQELMTQELLKGFTNISENLCAINKNILDNSTSTQLMIQRVEQFISKQQISWTEVILSRIWSPPSPS